MAVSVISYKTMLVPSSDGGTAKRVLASVFFDATDATVEVPVPGLTYVENVQITACAVAALTGPDSDQFCWVDEAMDGGGGFRVPSTGKITIGQTGASSVAMKYFVVVEGW